MLQPSRNKTFASDYSAGFSKLKTKPQKEIKLNTLINVKNSRNTKQQKLIKYKRQKPLPQEYPNRKSERSKPVIIESLHKFGEQFT